MSIASSLLFASQFETVGEAENCGSVQTASCHTVNRRYSEFLNLQTRLEDNPEVKRVIKSKDGDFRQKNSLFCPERQ